MSIRKFIDLRITKIPRPLMYLMIIASLIVIINPITNINIILTASIIFILAYYILQEYMLLLFLIIRPFLDIWRNIIIFSHEHITLNMNALLGILASIWIILMLLRYKKYIFSTPSIYIWIVLILLSALSFFFSVSKILTIEELIRFFILGGFFILSYIFIKQKIITLYQLINSIFLSSILPLLIALLQLMTGHGITTSDDITGRIYGTFAHPNVLAFFIMTLIFILFEQAILTQTKYWKKNKDYIYIFFILLFVLLIFTYTRAAWMGTALFFFILGLHSYRRLFFLMISTSIIGYMILIPIPHYIRQHFDINITKIQLIERLTTRNEDADSISWRQQVVRETIPIIQKRMLYGYGFGTFPMVWEDNRPSYHMFESGREAHNDYLRYALEIGIIGLILYISLLFRLLSYAYMKQRQFHWQAHYLVLSIWIAVFIIVSLSDNMLHHTSVVWMTFSLWGAYLAYHHKPTHANPNLLEDK